MTTLRRGYTRKKRTMLPNSSERAPVHSRSKDWRIWGLRAESRGSSVSGDGWPSCRPLYASADEGAVSVEKAAARFDHIRRSGPTWSNKNEAALRRADDRRGQRSRDGRADRESLRSGPSSLRDQLYRPPSGAAAPRSTMTRAELLGTRRSPAEADHVRAATPRLAKDVVGASGRCAPTILFLHSHMRPAGLAGSPPPRRGRGASEGGSIPAAFRLRRPRAGLLRLDSLCRVFAFFPIAAGPPVLTPRAR